MKYIARLFPAVAAVTLFSSLGYSTTLDLGYVAFDITNPPLAEVDIVNLTGPNALPPTFGTTTPVNFTNLSLTVDFKSGSPETFGPSSKYFTLQSDGLSYDGQDIFNDTTNPVTEVILTGNLSPTTVTSNGTKYTISPATFTATVTPSSGSTLNDGDFALITASATPATSSGVPEPRNALLCIAGLLCLLAFTYFRKIRAKNFRRLGFLSLITSLAAFGSSPTSVTLESITTPSSGVSGTTDVWVTGSGFPSGAFTSVTVSLATSCAATGTTTSAIAERDVVGSVEKIEFLVPASLTTGTYYVSVSGSTTGGSFTSGTSCSAIQVTHTSTVLASCNPGSSMGILSYNPTGAATTPVTAYVPNGRWSDGGSDGVQVVPIEGGGSPSSVSTGNAVNSCSSNSITGETVCIDSFTDIYLVNGSTLTTTLSSGANAYSSFSGGDCENCTVAVNEAAGTKGQAVIGLGYSSSPSGTALQFLDLASNTLGSPVVMNEKTSEDILWDPFRNLVLSPNESGYYGLFQVTGSGIPGPSTVSEYSNYGGYTFDSAAEDCTTQIALASVEEYTASGVGLYITDLSQKKTSGGSYTAPSQFIGEPEFYEFSAATDGIAVAPGSTHLGVITGEFGGNQFAALSLPAKSGSGTPALVDYVAAALPPTPDGCNFSSGYDPHTTTAYTSPNTGKAYGVMADWAAGAPDYLAVVDLAALLKAPRKSGIYPNGTACTSCVNVVDPSYNLLTNGVVTYIGTGNTNCKGASTSTTATVKSDAIKKSNAAAAPAEKPVNNMPQLNK